MLKSSETVLPKRFANQYLEISHRIDMRIPCYPLFNIGTGVRGFSGSPRNRISKYLSVRCGQDASIAFDPVSPGSLGDLGERREFPLKGNNFSYSDGKRRAARENGKRPD